ncbi:DUF2971 domain-containing protein [Pseudoalteromonas denitrificans]|uniref:DUF2971 domain-containing protein n=1 Tax=Pseudoalteromonas denitrificans DSM 6059 TaxID=1123010 RepID=A0A1I1KD28_9GAMM|nr:DUF2971 domain-containing protein [Pseudoalteromonas denitrificans]SFC56618.1 Protein of unknown function [Pseudoalteromonas denitrificans DSM 6059]
MSQLYYHYTDASTALKILTNNELWLTHTKYLNDSNEGIDVLIYLERYIKNKEILKLLKFIDSRTEAYTCSFSKKKDLLSQWRGYCPPEEGYAIGFKSPEKFRGIMCDEGVSIKGMQTKGEHYCLSRHSHGFEACIYEEEEKEKVSQSMALRMEEKYIRLKSDMPEILENLNNCQINTKEFMQRLECDDVWLAQYIYYKYLFKNETFKEEHEYRFFVTFDSNYNQNPCYRSKGGAFIPYYRYCFGNEDVKKIIIRTTKTTEKCKQGLEHFLMNNKNMNHAEIDDFIETSNIPFQ